MPRGRLARRAALVAAGVAVPLCALGSMPATAATGGTVHVGDQAEAWYAASPVDPCTTPLGCTPSGAPSSPYAADTLHVGVAGGQETARTYVVPDLSQLPFDATAQTGTMTLPVATDTQSGTQSPQGAPIKACLATQPVQDGVQGSDATPPKVDCSVSSAAKYDAAKNAFSVDLAPFLAAWAGGKPPDGIALLPDSTKVQPTDAWHVAFNDRHRAGTPHIGSLISFVTTPTGTSASDLQAAAPPAAPPPAAPLVPSTGNLQHLSVPSTVTQPPNAGAPQVAPTPQRAAVAPRAFTYPRGFAYPLAFLTPLVLLAGAVFLGRLFTRDATPLGLQP